MKSPDYIDLSEICDIQIGKTPLRATSAFWGPGAPWLSISDMNQGKNISKTKETITEKAIKDCNCKLIEPGTLLFSFKLSIGKIGFAETALYTNEAIAALKIKDINAVDRDYLYWAMQVCDYSLSVDKAAKGGTLNQRKLREIRIPMFSFNEQKKIAAILNCAEALVQKNKKRLKKYDELLDACFTMIFGNSVPEVEFHELLEQPLRNGLSPSTKGKFSGHVLTLSAITQRGYNSLAFKPGVFDVKPPAEKTVDQRDFLICRGNGNIGLVGRGKFPSKTVAGLLFPDTMIGARIDQSKVLPQYLEVVWNRKPIREQIEAAARTTNGTFKVNQTMLEQILVPLPEMDSQIKFAAIARQIVQSRARCSEALVQMEELLESLTHQLFHAIPTNSNSVEECQISSS